jgi:N-methylhydantoinase B
MKGGKEGSYNYFQVLRNDGSIEKHNMATNLRLEKKEVVRLVTATGGGYGDPKLRPSEAVFDDIKNGYITTEQASEFYNL